MFESITFISVIFRLINFAILIALFTYLFKRYALETLKESMAGEQEALSALQQNKEQLTLSSRLATQSLADQEQLCIVLARKVDAWQAVCNHELAQRQQEKERLLQQLIAKNQEQSDNVAFDSVQRHVLPIVLVKAKAQLQTMFESEEKGRVYIEQLVEQLKKGKA